MAKIDDIEKMLKAVLTGLTTFRNEFLTFQKQVIQRFDEIDTKFDNKIDNLDKKLTSRLDVIGKQLAYLEDNAPTREEFDHLEKRVGKLENKPTLASS